MPGTGDRGVLETFTGDVPGYDDVRVDGVACPIDRPCVGQARPAPGVDGPHMLLVGVRFDPPVPTAPHAGIYVTSDPAGNELEGLRGVGGSDYLPVERADRLIQAWRAAISAGRITLRAGHPSEPDIDVDTYMAAWREIRPHYRRRGLVDALAARLARHPNTIRNYHLKYLWPLYEKPE